MEYKHIEVNYKDKSGYNCGFNAVNDAKDIRNGLGYTVTRLQSKFNVQLDEEKCERFRGGSGNPKPFTN